MDEFLLFLLWVLLLVVALSGVATANNYKDDDTIAAMVKDGADPIASRCAIRPDEKQCLVFVTKRECK